MSFIKWDESMSVGVKSLDEDHKKMIDMINKLYRSLKHGKNNDLRGEFFDKLLRYTHEHSVHEEELFEQTAYPDRQAHIKEHREHDQKLYHLYAQYKTNGKTVQALDLITELSGFWKKHMQMTDKQYAEHLIAHGIS